MSSRKAETTGRQEDRSNGGKKMHSIFKGSNPKLETNKNNSTLHDNFSPKVTVAVPNYNHEYYLRQRLDSIYMQTYKNFEVILMDDGSTDGSCEILEKYAEKYPDKTRLILNPENSGGTFHQWKTAINSTETELLWIAESDDYCDINFLESLVPSFADESVMLAYVRSSFVDENGRETSFSWENYLSYFSNYKWKRNYVETAYNEVREFLGVKNTIPNISSVLGKVNKDLSLLHDTEWENMRICGDWIYYLNIIRGGKISYSTGTQNYFRFHSSNSSAKTYSKPIYYKEHETVAREIVRLYEVPEETIRRHGRLVKEFFEQNYRTSMASGMIEFHKFYDFNKIQLAKVKRLPNVLIVIFGFSTGGGEIVPIHLANMLRQRGYGTTVYDFKGAPRNEAIRKLLNPAIPVIERVGPNSEVVNVIEELGIDLIHTHHASCDLFFGKAINERSLNVPLVVTTHGMYEAMKPSDFQSHLDNIDGAVSAWVYVADKNIRPFQEAGRYDQKNFFKITNAVGTPIVSNIDRASIKIRLSAFVVCLASRAISSKGWREAIAITHQARAISRKDIQLILLGDGPIYEDLLCEDLPNFVHLLGSVSNVVDHFLLSDIGLLPTTFPGESCPLSVIECLSAGRPVIASNIGEIPNMLRTSSGEYAGYLIQLEDGQIPIKKTAEQVARLASSARTYSAAASNAQKAASRFDMNSVTDRYSAVYDSAIMRTRRLFN